MEKWRKREERGERRQKIVRVRWKNGEKERREERGERNSVG